MQRRLLIAGIAIMVALTLFFVFAGFYQPAKHPTKKGEEFAAWYFAHDYLAKRWCNISSHRRGQYDDLEKNWYFEGDYQTWDGRPARFMCCVYLGTDDEWHVESYSFNWP
jgi:hypothetical protein